MAQEGGHWVLLGLFAACASWAVKTKQSMIEGQEIKPAAMNLQSTPLSPTDPAWRIAK